MTGTGSVRRCAPWLTVMLISFNAGWIASNIFDSNFSYYQCFQRPSPAKQADVLRHDMTQLSNSSKDSTVVNFQKPKSSMGTSQTLSTRTTTKTPTVKKTITEKETTLAPSIAGPKADVVEHKKGFNLMDYVNAKLPADNDLNFECLTGIAFSNTANRLQFPLCIFDPKIDIYVSAAIKRGHGVVWEADHVQRVLQQLGTPREDMGLIDIGANLGVFSLAAATAGHKVVSVEPMPSALRRLRKSIELGHIQDKISVVQAALSNDTGELFLNIDTKNKGGSFLVPKKGCTSYVYNHKCDINRPIPIIFMDDLLEIITFKNAIMKIDCEGFEYRAFKRSEKLLDTVNIPYILMEFMHYVGWWRKPSKKREVDKFIAYLKGKGYTPKTAMGIPLDSNMWFNWPNDITWTKQ